MVSFMTALESFVPAGDATAMVAREAGVADSTGAHMH